MIANLCEQRGYILLNFCKSGIYGMGHKCAVKRSLDPLQWIRQYVLMKPIGFPEKPFHIISFMGVAQAFFDNKSHETAGRAIIRKMIAHSHMFSAEYLHISFKETLKILPAPQDLFSG